MNEHSLRTEVAQKPHLLRKPSRVKEPVLPCAQPAHCDGRRAALIVSREELALLRYKVKLGQVTRHADAQARRSLTERRTARWVKKMSKRTAAGRARVRRSSSPIMPV